MKSLLILGRQPALGLAELESIFGAEKIQPLDSEAVLLDIEAKDVPFQRIGGSIKLARVLNELDTTSWPELENYLSKSILDHLKYVPKGKLKLGLSVYGFRINPKQLYASGLRLKKIIKATGRSVRIIPNKAPVLNSAQVLHNQLASPNGCELVFVRNGNKTILAQTYAEQDIEAYARRDQNRPFRDAKVGMLPPKLAQIIINLTSPLEGTKILDPFCGTGVLLQEALLMNLLVYGTDIEPRMIEYSTKNLECLIGAAKQQLEVGDATTHAWTEPVDAVAAETFLGKPLTSIPPRHILDQIRSECEDIHEKFLRNIGSQIKAGTRLCLAVPAWRIKSSFLHLKTLDHLQELGYTRLSFVHAKNEDLIYHREGQVVARELVVLMKK